MRSGIRFAYSPAMWAETASACLSNAVNSIFGVKDLSLSGYAHSWIFSAGSCFFLCSLPEKMKDPKSPLRNRGTHTGTVSVGPQSRSLFTRHRCISPAVRYITGQQPDSSTFHSNLPLLCIRLVPKLSFQPFCPSFKDAIVPAAGLFFLVFLYRKAL